VTKPVLTSRRNRTRLWKAERVYRTRFSRSALREYLAAWFACSPYEQELFNAVLGERGDQ
jgi:hypothetical protein